jgi:ribosome-associated translation inhibitor RaiA
MSPRGFPVEIRSPSFSITPALRQYALEHLAAKLVKFDGHILGVVVRFEDRNGPRGGPERNGPRNGGDKVCRVEVLLPHIDPIVVEEVDDDLRAAIDIAADRTAESVFRDLKRLLAQRKHVPQA